MTKTARKNFWGLVLRISLLKIVVIPLLSLQNMNFQYVFGAGTTTAMGVVGSVQLSEALLSM